MWTINVFDKDHGVLIPTTKNVEIYSLSSVSAWQGIKICIHCHNEQANFWKKSIQKTDLIHLARFSSKNDVEDFWEIKVDDIPSVMVKELNSGLHKSLFCFSIKGNFVKST